MATSLRTLRVTATDPVRPYRIGARVARTLPRPIAFGLARVIGWVASRRASRGRAQMVRHLRRATGRDIQPNDPLVSAAFASYARYWCESFRLPGSPAAVFDTGMSIEGAEHLEAAMAKGRGVILVLAHLGGWELGGCWLALAGYRLVAVVEALEPPAVFAWFAALRSALGMEVIPADADAGRRISAALRDAKLVVLPSDRDITGGGVVVPFLGEPTRMPAGAATLALRTGAVIVPVCVPYERDGRVRAIVSPALDSARTPGRLRDDVVRITAEIAAALEPGLRTWPQHWHLLQPNWPSDPGYRWDVSDSEAAAATAVRAAIDARRDHPSVAR